ncbi:hypothetical protein KFE25_011223 [Diacronema lutheri]|uniref:Uncharacterized protein n=2 Tax=Diacronema lutheri TaxID=2081491 RepID=A0A8J5X7Y9_DIALT|nr:hypothetical protein KFE25_011223 [Diacronema lutheri]
MAVEDELLRAPPPRHFDPLALLTCGDATLARRRQLELQLDRACLASGLACCAVALQSVDLPFVPSPVSAWCEPLELRAGASAVCGHAAALPYARADEPLMRLEQAAVAQLALHALLPLGAGRPLASGRTPARRGGLASTVRPLLASELALARLAMAAALGGLSVAGMECVLQGS